ncbi:MAG: hypothetical protein JXB46_03245 [Candidatus Eisenbacteria bacterium]|nr:hypothetical protein [Candidatus Eisenbacteria bacterium]
MGLEADFGHPAAVKGLLDHLPVRVATTAEERKEDLVLVAPGVVPVVDLKAVVSGADALLFDANERGPTDGMRLQFEALSRLDERERGVVREVLKGLLIKHDAEQWMRGKQATEQMESPP